MTCRYCGLETGSGAGHRSQAECIRALTEEIERAKRLIGSDHQPGTTARRPELQIAGDRPGPRH